MVKSIHDIKTQVTEELRKKRGVVSVGIGYKVTEGERTVDLAIVVGVIEKLPLLQIAVEDRLPGIIEGVKTDVVEVGKIQAQMLRTERIRPAPRGISIGHRDITAGTLGCIVKTDGERYILSNNHVLANSNMAEIGDPILQPGKYDQGIEGKDTIAILTDYVPINFTGDPSDCPLARFYAWLGNAAALMFGRKSRIKTYTTAQLENVMDAAIAKPISNDMLSPESFEGWTVLDDMDSAYLGQKVRKSGRTTGSTYGHVTQISVTVTVGYGGGKSALFEDQIIIESLDGTSFSAPGDSGSIVQNMGNSAVALLFAGSEKVTVCNRIERVLDAFEVDIG
jgi:hypothetical protein